MALTDAKNCVRRPLGFMDPIRLLDGDLIFPDRLSDVIFTRDYMAYLEPAEYKRCVDSGGVVRLPAMVFTQIGYRECNIRAEVRSIATAGHLWNVDCGGRPAQDGRCRRRIS